MAVLHFEGHKDVPHDPGFVRARLADGRFLVECVPGREAVARAEPRSAACTLRPGFAFVRGTLDISFDVAETGPAEPVRVAVHGKAIGSSSDVEVRLDPAAHEGGTRVRWVAEVTNLGGLLKAVPQGLIKAAAQKVIADALAAVERQLAGEPGT